MRPIDADALVEVFAHLIPWCIDTQEEIAFTNGLSSAYEATRNAPTIDAVPVVRCKDCRWFGKIGCAIEVVDETDMPKENDFCSFAERKTMSDYIKREDVIDAVCGDCPYNCSEVRKEKHPCMEYKELMAIPSADVAPVVRCKDCRYYQDNNGGYPNANCKWCKDETPDADDYCSCAERKDDE